MTADRQIDLDADIEGYSGDNPECRDIGISWEVPVAVADGVRARTAGSLVDTGSDKFGAPIGDSCRIGANAMLSPGICPRGNIVGRLELVAVASP